MKMVYQNKNVAHIYRSTVTMFIDNATIRLYDFIFLLNAFANSKSHVKRALKLKMFIERHKIYFMSFNIYQSCVCGDKNNNLHMKAAKYFKKIVCLKTFT